MQNFEQYIILFYERLYRPRQPILQLLQKWELQVNLAKAVAAVDFNPFHCNFTRIYVFGYIFVICLQKALVNLWAPPLMNFECFVNFSSNMPNCSV